MLRVMTYNIWEGAAGREAVMLAVIERAQPDLLLLQEVVAWEDARRWAAALGLSLCFAPSNARRRNVALLSRYQITVCASFHPFPLLRTLLLATVQLPGEQWLNIFGVHLGLIHDLWRAYELRVILARIAAFQRAHPTPLALLAGDFNSVARGDRVTVRGVSWLYRLVLALQFAPVPRVALAQVQQAGFADCFRACQPSADGFTVPAHAPNVRLDYCFASSTLVQCLRACAPLTDPPAAHASDHLPLVTEFELPTGPVAPPRRRFTVLPGTASVAHERVLAVSNPPTG